MRSWHFWIWLASAIITSAVWFSVPAHADPEADFLKLLTDSGITVYSADMALFTGQSICTALETTNGAIVAENLYKISMRSEVPTRDTADVWVMVAGATLCPWQFHPQSIDDPALSPAPEKNDRPWLNRLV